jgi:hypothetical protein
MTVTLWRVFGEVFLPGTESDRSLELRQENDGSNPETFGDPFTPSGTSVKLQFMKKLNWQIWAGFVLSLIAGLSYPFVFVRWPITRDLPWVNFVLFALALVLLFLGLRRAFKPDKKLVSKIFSSLAAALGILMAAGFIFAVLVIGRSLPASPGAPQIGQKAPDFTLTDANDKPITLAQLLTEPINNKRPRGVLLIFYRGYW